MTQAYGYLRVSSVGQAGEDKHGLPRQREAIESYAAAHDIEIVQWFEDAGVSGTNDVEGRPALALMLWCIDCDGVRVVLIERLDRLARDLMLQEHLIAKLKMRNVQLVSAADGGEVTADDPSRKLVRQIMGAVAEYDKVLLVAKLRAARDFVRARDGRCEGQPRYGSTDLYERTVVERIHELRRKRMGHRRWGCHKIAAALNREGWHPRHAIQWTPKFVLNIIHGPVYTEVGRHIKD